MRECPAQAALHFPVHSSDAPSLFDACSGRKIMFKGTITERNQPKRQQEIEARMKGMPKRIEAWKKVCRIHRHSTGYFVDAQES